MDRGDAQATGDGSAQDRASRFQGILFEGPRGAGASEVTQVRGEPESFADLNLAPVVDAIVAGREEYDLKPYFHAPLHDVSTVRYRHEVLRDLEKEEIAASVRGFAQRMRRMRECMGVADRLRHRYQKERWFLDGADVYCDAVRTLAEELSGLDVTSRGLRAFRGYLVTVAGSPRFASLSRETHGLLARLREVKYDIHIRGNRVTVSDHEGAPDYSAEVEKTFAKFQQGAVKDYRAKLADFADVNWVEGRILDLVARLHPDLFRTLDEYRTRHAAYLDRTVRAFDREVQFYLSYLEYIERLRAAGLPFCYPDLSAGSTEVHAEEAFDLALANKLVAERGPVVRNDFFLEEPERIIVVTGPNQGGKTTFARMFGQLHYLGSLGLPVPAKEARLLLPDRVFTHFEKEEDLATLRGKLDDELVRVRQILDRATARSVIVMNETFTSTTLDDALFLGTEVLGRVADLGSLSVYVTFADELASLNEATVSMVATVSPDDPTVRTFRVVRMPANGLAYASALAQKYGLAYEWLRRRVVP
jgi:hypothetical protein